MELNSGMRMLETVGDFVCAYSDEERRSALRKMEFKDDSDLEEALNAFQTRRPVRRELLYSTYEREGAIFGNLCCRPHESLNPLDHSIMCFFATSVLMEYREKHGTLFTVPSLLRVVAEAVFSRAFGYVEVQQFAAFVQFLTESPQWDWEQRDPLRVCAALVILHDFVVRQKTANRWTAAGSTDRDQAWIITQCKNIITQP